jgi:hypothetical protein
VVLGAIAVGLCAMLAVAVLALARSLAYTQRMLQAVAYDLDAQRAATERAVAQEDDRSAEPVEPLPPYLSLARPVIKARALSAGTTSAARVLRERLSNGKH